MDKLTPPQVDDKMKYFNLLLAKWRVAHDSCEKEAAETEDPMEATRLRALGLGWIRCVHELEFFLKVHGIDTKESSYRRLYEATYRGMYETAMETAYEAMEYVQRNQDKFKASAGDDKLAIICREFLKAQQDEAVGTVVEGFADALGGTSHAASWIGTPPAIGTKIYAYPQQSAAIGYVYGEILPDGTRIAHGALQGQAAQDLPNGTPLYAPPYPSAATDPFNALLSKPVKLDALVVEGLDYFERSGDEGDKKYVAAIRAALGVKA